MGRMVGIQSLLTWWKVGTDVHNSHIWYLVIIQFYGENISLLDLHNTCICKSHEENAAFQEVLLPFKGADIEQCPREKQWSRHWPAIHYKGSWLITLSYLQGLLQPLCGLSSPSFPPHFTPLLPSLSWCRGFLFHQSMIRKVPGTQARHNKCLSHLSMAPHHSHAKFIPSDP